MSMIKKITHIADLHIRLYKRHQEYREQFIKFLDLQRELNPDRIVIAGDIVHSKNQMTPELIELVAWFLTECAKIAPTVIIPGNHDLLVNNLDRMDALSPILNALQNDRIKYYTHTGCHLDDNVVWCIYSQLEGNIRPGIEEARKEHGDKQYIGIYHDPIVGLKTDVGYEFEEGQSVDIFDGLDYTLCGDIHKRQVLKNSQGRPVIMVGSTIQQGFGESHDKHGYCVIDLENDEYEFVDIDSDYGYYTFKIDSIEDITKDKEILVR